MQAATRKQVEGVASALVTCAGAAPKVGIVLGSGLGALVDAWPTRRELPFEAIAAMPRSTVEGHAGNFVCAEHGSLAVIAMQGRLHLYEGYGPETVVLGVRAMVTLGARTILLTNASGGIREDLSAGTLMLIEDHLNLTGTTCLLGPNDAALGPRFPALDGAYDPGLRLLASAVARDRGVPLAAGVYAGMLGPAYETPAEVRMLRALGADAVGMSTVLETIAARHMGARVLGLSCITNRAAGLGASAPSHTEVQEVAKATEARFVSLITGVLDALRDEATP